MEPVQTYKIGDIKIYNQHLRKTYLFFAITEQGRYFQDLYFDREWEYNDAKFDFEKRAREKLRKTG